MLVHSLHPARTVPTNPSSAPGRGQRAASAWTASRWSLLAALSLGMVALLAGHPAKAALGGDVGSVEADRLQFQASAQHAVRLSFSVHSLTMANGTVVREYLAANGAVFAVSWHGRSIPDLKQLLGVHFSTFDASPHRERGGLGHLVVRDAAQNPNLVVESNGRARSFHGRAYLNNALPAGISTNDIE